MWWLTGLFACGTPEVPFLPAMGPAPANPPEPIAWTHPPTELTTPVVGPPEPWPPFTELAAAADEVNLRSEPSLQAAVVRRLPLGTVVRVLEAVGDPETVVGRTDRWYRVTVTDADGTHIGGYAFGATLTPVALELPDGGRVVASFSADRQPRIRYRTPTGELRARDLGSPGPGGTLGLSTTARGFVQAELCRDGGCTTWLVTLTDHIGVLPPFASRDQVHFWTTPLGARAVRIGSDVLTERADGTWTAMDGGDLEVAVLAQGPAADFQPPPLLLDAPWASEPTAGDLHPAPAVVPCGRLGTLSGDSVLGCTWRVPDPPGPARWVAARFLVSAEGWHPLPTASSNLDDVARDTLLDTLRQRGEVVLEPDRRAVRGLTPVPVPYADDGGRLTLLHHHPPPDNRARAEVLLLDHPVAGRVLVDATSTGAPGGRARVAEVDGSVRAYAWLPWAHDVEGQLTETAPPARWFATLVGCDDQIVRSNVVLQGLPDEVPLLAGVLGQVPVFSVPLSHGAVRRTFPDATWAETETEQPPLLVVRDPWDRWIGLVREDLRQVCP